MAKSREFPSVYRAVVISNTDPQRLGRVQVKVPSELPPQETRWAARCAPLAGKGKGAYFMPEAGDEVLVAFERGEANSPIVIGSLWSGPERPPAAEGANPPDSLIVIQSKAQHTILIRDAPGPLSGVEIRSANGARISVNNVAISIDNGNGASIVLEGSSVVVNGKPLRA